MFIRVPWAEQVGEDAEAFAAEPHTGKIVAVRRGPALATVFHLELTGDRRIRELFVTIVRQGSGAATSDPPPLIRAFVKREPAASSNHDGLHQ